MDIFAKYSKKQDIEKEKRIFRQPVIEFHSGSNIMECCADCFLTLIEIDEKSQQPKIITHVPSALSV